MISLTTKLVGDICPVSGEIGLRDIRVPNRDDYTLDTGDGSLLAHDYIDHQHGLEAIGTIEDELKALGCAWAIRGHYAGELQEDGIAGDLTDMYQYFTNRTRLKPVPVTRSHVLDDDFERILDAAQEQARLYVLEYSPTNFAHFRPMALAYMRKGIRRMHRRYRTTHPESQAYDNYIAIRDAIRKVDIMDGMYYTLRLRDGHCTITEDEVFH
ncbi:hypothetical protein [Alteromonas sp. RKMC-009]|uniref:hypothetical protein n=1 Tax=Alteromonas sp. RKMC-009 TaxID=2267264 RepID=UPI000E69A086|nr:hypothetical protein [Alteromonas sp. RKMC-009]AYA64269.1 hypothetical protein DS731_09840 [Alteromonas sp. RKMC-009]